ncbi:MAG TPA: hypothetical protein VM487_04330 [Phycisphaerae bacterium]|nr:hypothetical protein [Phycisphaerae bacterium]
MLQLKTADYNAPAIAAAILYFRNKGNLAPLVVVENLDASASAAIRYQESDDAQNWTDISNTTATVNPGESNGQVVTSARSFIALHAGGNVKLSVGLVQQINGAPTNLGDA